MLRAAQDIYSLLFEAVEIRIFTKNFNRANWKCLTVSRQKLVTNITVQWKPFYLPGLRAALDLLPLENRLYFVLDLQFPSLELQTHQCLAKTIWREAVVSLKLEFCISLETEMAKSHIV